MKTKREVLEEFAKNGDCENINCKKECPYCFSDKCLDLDLRKIGAMAILRMFREKENPTLYIGAKIKFDDGRIGVLEKEKNAYVIRFEHSFFHWEYLIGKKWEIVE